MSEKKRLPIGISDFKKLITEKCYYFDKSLFIEEILKYGSEVTLMPRPRRFGKTLNLSMLRYFLEKTEDDNSYLFKDLAIGKNEEVMNLQGQSPVVFMTFKDIKVATWEKCYEGLKGVIAAEYRRHKYLVDSDTMDKTERSIFLSVTTKKASEIEFQESLKNLSEYLARHHKKTAFILIDEYDTPIQEGFMSGYNEEVISFMRNFLSGGLKDNINLNKGVITGILRISKENIFSGLNNLEVCGILDQAYSDKFGLLEHEVVEALKYYGVEDKSEEVKCWYNGYMFDEVLVYNPWSIINFIKKQCRLAPYWVNTSQNALINELLAEGMNEIKEDFELLLSGKTIDKSIEEDIVLGDVRKNPDVVWNLLLFSGYLTFTNKKWEKRHLVYSLKIPNQEVSYIFEKIISSWFSKSIGSKNYELMLKSLTDGDVETFTEKFQEFLLSSISFFDVGGKKPEKVYHAFVLGMLLSLGDSYDVKSNRESGHGRYDVILIPHDSSALGIVIEFKVAKKKELNLEESAQEALEQIERKGYVQELNDRGIKKHLLIGMAFCVKELEVIHKIS